MKVLMFGWEYPPHVFGGLATANYGISRPREIWTSRSVCLILSVMRVSMLVVSSP